MQPATDPVDPDREAVSITFNETPPDQSPTTLDTGTATQSPSDELNYVLDQIGITPPSKAFIMKEIDPKDIFDLMSLPQSTWDYEAYDSGNISPAEANKIVMFKKWMQVYMEDNGRIPKFMFIEFNARVFNTFIVVQSIEATKSVDTKTASPKKDPTRKIPKESMFQTVYSETMEKSPRLLRACRPSRPRQGSTSQSSR